MAMIATEFRGCARAATLSSWRFARSVPSPSYWLTRPLRLACRFCLSCCSGGTRHRSCRVGYGSRDASDAHRSVRPQTNGSAGEPSQKPRAKQTRVEHLVVVWARRQHNGAWRGRDSDGRQPESGGEPDVCDCDDAARGRGPAAQPDQAPGDHAGQTAASDTSEHPACMGRRGLAAEG